MGATTTTKTQADLLGDAAKEACKDVQSYEKVFSSGNTGLYKSVTLLAPAARALGIAVPTGGKVKVTIQVLVTDPANSKNA